MAERTVAGEVVRVAAFAARMGSTTGRGAVAGSLMQRLDRQLARLGRTALIPLLILALAWTQELVDQLLFGGRWNLPMLHGGPLWGVFTAPFSHGSFSHLISNSLWFLPLSWLVLAKGRRDYLAVWIGVVSMAIPVWWLWPENSHGLSGVVYGLLGYLLLIGWLERHPFSLLLSLLALVSYGGILPTLLPLFTPAGVSWMGHASGFVGGLLAALAVHRQPGLPDSDAR